MSDRKLTSEVAVAKKLNASERAVLSYLAPTYEDLCFPFAPIMEDTGLDRKTVRRACRSLRRKGLTSYHNALCSEDGELAGAGYCATKLGYQVNDALHEEPKQ